MRRFGEFVKFRMGAKVVGKNAAGDRILKQIAYSAKFALAFQAAQVGNFPPAENLDALVGKILIKAHYRAHGAVQVWQAYFICQALPSPYAAEVKRIVFFEIDIYQVQHRKADIGHNNILLKKQYHGKVAGLNMTHVLSAYTPVGRAAGLQKSWGNLPPQPRPESCSATEFFLI
jgi:hypothetical protein